MAVIVVMIVATSEIGKKKLPTMNKTKEIIINNDATNIFSLKTSKMFSNNVANGLATEYYEDGSVKSECTYKNGEVKGKVKEYKKGEKKIES